MRSPRPVPIVALLLLIAVPSTLFAQSTGARWGCALRVNGMTVHAGESSDDARSRGSTRESAAAASCVNVPFCTFGPYPSTGACEGRAAVPVSDNLIYYFYDVFTGLPIPNCPAAIELYPHQQTGGHCHTDGQRPVEYPAGAVPRIVTGNTGADGLQFVVQHTWPEASGGIDVVFYSTVPGCPFYNDHTVKFIHCVFEDVYSELGTGTGYGLIGSLTEHPSNHFGTDALLGKLAALGVDFHAADSTTNLGYNDMSLPWGGAFDLNQNWRAPHCGHRIGKAIDIRTRTLNKAKRTRLESLLKKHGFGIYKHADGSHWHCTLRG